MSSICLTSLLCLLATTQVRSTQSAEVSPKIEKFLKVCEQSRRGAILKIEHTLRGLRRESSKTADATGRIANLEAQLRVLRSNTQPVVPQLAFPPQTGAIGRLPRLSCHVDQIVSDDELLVRCYFPVVVTTVRRFQARREKVVRPVRALIRGLPTQDIDQGTDVEMLQVFEVVGKERYRTADGGSNEILVLTNFDMKSIEPYFRKVTGQNGPPRQPIQHRTGMQ